MNNIKTIAFFLVLFLTNPLTYPIIDKIVKLDIQILNQVIIICSIYFVLVQIIVKKILFSIWAKFSLTILIFLIFDSLLTQGAIFSYAHVYSKITVLFFSFFIYLLSRYANYPNLKLISYFILLSYMVHMLLFGADFGFRVEGSTIDNSAGDARIIHAEGIFLILLPWLTFLDDYLKNKNKRSILLFFLCTTIIVLHQHRTVWGTAIVSSFIYFFYYLKYSSTTFIKATFLVFFIFIVVVISIIVLPDRFLSYFESRFLEVFAYDSENTTGYTRYMQYKYYWPYVKDNFLAGMRFESRKIPDFLLGFNQGVHFHTYYLDTFFYLGLIGFITIFGFMTHVVLSAFKEVRNNQHITILMSIVISQYFFSLSYCLDYTQIGLIGLLISYIEQSKIRKLHDIYNNPSL